MTSIDGDTYVQRLSSYIRRNEEALANGLLCFSKNRTSVKPIRLSFTIHHLYYITERIESSPLGVDVGPLNVKVDNPNHEPTFISFMANNARSKHFDSDTRSITSINSMKSIISSASLYWRSSTLKEPKSVNKDIKYLYSSFTKIPCLILCPSTKVGSIATYEEFPCDTSVPIKMFKNLQVLELVDYEPNEIFGWNILSERLRILIIRNLKISDISEVMVDLVVEDESHRRWETSLQSQSQQSQQSNIGLNGLSDSYPPDHYTYTESNSAFLNTPKSPHILPDNKWALLKQLTITDTSITSIPHFIFKPMSNLVKLNLSNNLLQELPHGLHQLTNIKFINFSDNYITNLNDLPRNLKNLTTLNFNNNKLTDLSGLEHLSYLEKIDLRRNNLEEILSLKPIVLQFIKNPLKFSSVYLLNNKLPKTYRTDLFNLINGVKYKNNMRLDDSKPGYFESAILLDAELAFKNLEVFFGVAPTEVALKLALQQTLKLTLQQTLKLALQQTLILAQQQTPKLALHDPSSLLNLPTLLSLPKIPLKQSLLTPLTPLVMPLLSLPLSSLPTPLSKQRLVVAKDEVPPRTPKEYIRKGSSSKEAKQDPKSTGRKERNITPSPSSHTSLPTLYDSNSSNNSPKALLEPFSVVSEKKYKQIPRTFSLSNTVLTTESKFDLSILTSSPLGSTSPRLPHVGSTGCISALKKSSTMTQLELEPLAGNSPSAPSVITPIQVTARMST